MFDPRRELAALVWLEDAQGRRLTRRHRVRLREIRPGYWHNLTAITLALRAGGPVTWVALALPDGQVHGAPVFQEGQAGEAVRFLPTRLSFVIVPEPRPPP